MGSPDLRIALGDRARRPGARGLVVGVLRRRARPAGPLAFAADAAGDDAAAGPVVAAVLREDGRRELRLVAASDLRPGGLAFVDPGLAPRDPARRRPDAAARLRRHRS